MTGYIDLHCHWVVGIDDGVRTAADSRALLAGLAGAGFGKVIATPHMRAITAVVESSGSGTGTQSREAVSSSA